MPKEFRFECDEVEILKGEGGVITLIPRGWDALFRLLDEDGVSEDFMGDGDERESLLPGSEIESL